MRTPCGYCGQPMWQTGSAIALHPACEAKLGMRYKQPCSDSVELSHKIDRYDPKRDHWTLIVNGIETPIHRDVAEGLWRFIKAQRIKGENNE